MASSDPSAAQLQRNEIKEFVEKTISDHQVVIFSKTYCGYCRTVKNLFATQYTEVTPKIVELDQLEHDAATHSYLKETEGQRTVPYVFINQKLIGGADKTVALSRSGELPKLLKSTPQAFSSNDTNDDIETDPTHQA